MSNGPIHLRPPSISLSTPWDIIITFESFNLKANIFRALRDIPNLQYNKSPIIILQDIASDTLKQRRSYKNITDALMKTQLFIVNKQPIHKGTRKTN
uniref:Uncharacterized protein n=1 Tax=Salvator merianae TaxID=96440 RepID=A0A8D0DSQ2_SALMN